jgi:hypothetical protein
MVVAFGLQFCQRGTFPSPRRSDAQFNEQKCGATTAVRHGSIQFMLTTKQISLLKATPLNKTD